MYVTSLSFTGLSQMTVSLPSIPLLGAQLPVKKAYGEDKTYLQMFLTLALDGEG